MSPHTPPPRELPPKPPVTSIYQSALEGRPCGSIDFHIGDHKGVQYEQLMTML